MTDECVCAAEYWSGLLFKECPTIVLLWRPHWRQAEIYLLYCKGKHNYKIQSKERAHFSLPASSNSGNPQSFVVGERKLKFQVRESAAVWLPLFFFIFCHSYKQRWALRPSFNWQRLNSRSRLSKASSILLVFSRASYQRGCNACENMNKLLCVVMYGICHTFEDGRLTQAKCTMRPIDENVFIHFHCTVVEVIVMMVAVEEHYRLTHPSPWSY